jgi:predicted aspartyl protease
MITGVVHVNLDAVIPLAVRDAAGVMRQMDAVIDTGFTGFLTLPTAEMAALGLTWLSREQGVLADGSTRLFDVYRGRPLCGTANSAPSRRKPSTPLLSSEWNCFKDMNCGFG